ncbi:GNAT family N-acetyltransferase [Nocardioides bruguierae]|uniref:GNAT family N-acetyltransferase n=1 Tax=Nocardioides bruguierae TaxID=2945102 RepID=A0A9X2IFR9_9ACTN|nr:GNAT family N-acetyltransferase [Nocardioides bruguierae]MCM0620020.1 GNAT family N-acetyltransferase [Nocardioides bruguierae]
MDDPDLDARTGLRWTPLVRADLPDLARLYEVTTAHDEDPERQSLPMLEEFVDSPRSRPAEDVRVGRSEDGTLVAVAWAGCHRSITEVRRVHLGGAVHPAWRRRGIGGAVLAWQLAHARAWDEATREPGHGPLVARLYAPVGQGDVRDLATRHGLEVARYFTEMTRPLTDLPAPRGVPGVRLVDLDLARSAEIHRVLDTAFADHWGHADRTDDVWADQIGSSVVRPAWSVMALDEGTGAIVGVALSCAYEQDWAAEGRSQGYTDELGVLRSHRGRGVATALLVDSMHRFAAAGLDSAGLGVDTANPSGALGLYRSLGYTDEAATCVHEWSRP